MRCSLSFDLHQVPFSVQQSIVCFSQSLKELVEENKMEVDGFPFQRKLCIDGRIKELSITIGELRIMCSFAIVGKDEELKLHSFM